jgi:hypothetical protein
MCVYCGCLLKTGIVYQQRQSLRGNNSSVHTFPRPRSYATEAHITSASAMPHTTIRDLREVVLPRGPRPGGQCRYNGARDTSSPTSSEEWCFLLCPCRGYISRIDTSPVEALPYGRRDDYPQSNPANRRRQGKPRKTKALKPLPENRSIHGKLKGLNACCSELWSL